MIRCKIELHDIGNTCPVCGEQALDASMDDRDDGEYRDTYQCKNCGLVITYISKDDGREYHEYRNGEIEVELELFWGGFEHIVNDVSEMLDDIIAAEEMAENDNGYKFLLDLVQRAKAMKAKLTSDNPASEG